MNQKKDWEKTIRERIEELEASIAKDEEKIHSGRLSNEQRIQCSVDIDKTTYAIREFAIVLGQCGS